MKKILLTSTAVAMATFASNAAVSPYVAARIGYMNASLISSSDSNGDLMGDLSGRWFGDKFAFDLAGAVGVKYDMSKNFTLRGELEYDYADGFKNGETSKTIWQRSHTVLANAYLDFKTLSAFTPYITAGLGVQFNHVNVPLGSESTPTVFARQLGAGVTYNVTNRFAVDFGYRYLTSKYSYTRAAKDYKLGTDYSQFRLGASYAF